MIKDIDELIQKIEALEDEIDSPYALYENGYKSGLYDAVEVVKKLNQPAVSVEHDPVASGAVCPHFGTCQNKGKNEYCDLQTLKELDCFLGQTER